MSEHHPEETMPVAASDLDCADLSDELIDELLAGARTPEEITGPDGLLQRLHVSPGRHDVTFKLEGYKTHRMRVYVGPDATLKLHHEMQKGTGETFEDLSGGAPPRERETRRERDDDEDDDPAEPSAETEPSGEFGRLQLTVEPEDASVYVDGAFRGTGREASSIKLAPGRHRIDLPQDAMPASVCHPRQPDD